MYEELIQKLRESVTGNHYPKPALLLQAADTIEALNAQLAAKEPAGNALTIEELLKTKAKPVWCEWKDSGWVLTLWDYIVSFSQGDRHGAVFFISKDGKTWFAYSGSPKEE